MKKYRNPIILLVFGLWLALLLSGIIWVNIISHSGQEVLLDMTAYDPYDPLRGRYLELDLSDSWVELDAKSVAWAEQFYDGEFPVYAVMEPGEDSYGFVYATRERPKEGLYLKCNATYSSGGVYLYPKIEQYYVSQKDADRLDQLVRQEDCDLKMILKVQKGWYAVEGLLINGIRY